MRAPVPWARPGSAPRPFRRRPVRVPGTTEPGGPLALGQICRFARARPRACFACVWAGRSRRCVVASLAARNRASARPSRPAWPGSGPGRDFFIRSRPEPGSGLARSRPGPAGSGPGRPMRWQSTSSCSPVSPSDILTPSVRLGGDSERTAWGATRRADGRRRLAAPARDYANGRTGQAVRSRQTDIIPNALGIIIQYILPNALGIMMRCSAGTCPRGRSRRFRFRGLSLPGPALGTGPVGRANRPSLPRPSSRGAGRGRDKDSELGELQKLSRPRRPVSSPRPRPSRRAGPGAPSAAPVRGAAVAFVRGPQSNPPLRRRLVYCTVVS